MVGIPLSGHAFLWKHSIEHINPSLWNVKYHPIRKYGVLTDFDLPAMSWRTRVAGSNRTGTIPFMALDLLFGEYGEDKVTRHYHHELEAFIWMLPFVFLAYDNGELDPKNRFIKYWITSDQLTCRKEKLFFLSITTWLNPYLWWEALSRATKCLCSKHVSLSGSRCPSGKTRPTKSFCNRCSRREARCPDPYLVSIILHVFGIISFLFYLAGASTPPGFKGIGPVLTAHIVKICLVKSRPSMIPSAFLFDHSQCGIVLHLAQILNHTYSIMYTCSK